MTERLRAHRKKQAELRLHLGAIYAGQGLVFASLTGAAPGSEPHAARPEGDLERSKRPKTIRGFDLRHTLATLLLAASENVKVVAEGLGRGKTTRTLDLCAHVLPGMQEGAAQRLEEVLFTKLRESVRIDRRAPAARLRLLLDDRKRAVRLEINGSRWACISESETRQALLTVAGQTTASLVVKNFDPQFFTGLQHDPIEDPARGRLRIDRYLSNLPDRSAIFLGGYKHFDRIHLAMCRHSWCDDRAIVTVYLHSTRVGAEMGALYFN